MRKLLIVLLTVPALLVLAPGAASAAPPTIHEHGSGTFPGPDEELVVIDCGDGLVIDEQGSFRFHDLVKPARDGVVDGAQEAFLAHSNYNFTIHHVNLDTGEGFSVHATGLFKERTAEHLEEYDETELVEVEEGVFEEQGPVFRFTAVENVHVQVRDDQGRVVWNARGRLLFEAVFATLGDNQPGGVLLEEEITVLNGIDPWAELDPCALAVELTT